jgi:calcium-dependent protein kinase
MAEESFSHNFSAMNTGKVFDIYKMDKKSLGEGSYGQVCTGTHKDTGAVRAVKSIDKAKVNDPKRFQAEVSIQAGLDHPNIVKLYEWFEDAKRYYLIMELCTGGELFDRIIEEVEKHDGQAFEEAVAASYMSQILGAMAYLHEKQFAHRDIKPENFLLQNKTKESALKVIDFGLAKQFTPGESKLFTKAGTPYYVAPEVLKSSKDQGYNEKCDIWSCGVLAYIMLCGYPPFYGDRDADILKMVKAGKFDFPAEDWSSTSNEAKDFITKMLVTDSKARPTASTIKDHAWLQMKVAKSTTKLSGDLGTKLKAFSTKGKFKKVALTLIAQQMKEEDLAEMQAQFKALDKNNDGTLTIKEIKEGMQKHGIKIDDESALAGLDTDGSGAIDYSEFLAAYMSMRTNWKKEQLWAAFRTFDKDNSGKIDASELQVVLQKTQKEVAELIAEADLNKDGMIDFEEFTAMMSK